MISGSTEFQKQVLATLGFTNIELYGREDYQRLPQAKRQILIDDLGFTTIGVQTKAQALCPEILLSNEYHFKAPESRFLHLQIKTWVATVSHEDQELLKTLEQLKQLLQPAEVA